MKPATFLIIRSVAHKHFRFLSWFLLLIFFQTAVWTQTPNHQWAKQLTSGREFFDETKSIASDASGAVYTTGTFSSTKDFDPGAGVYNLTAAAGADIFILKLDVNGNFVWAKQIAGSAGDDVATSIHVDVAGNIYVAGYFYGMVDFDPGPGNQLLSATNAGLSNAFILKLEAGGNFAWVKQLSGDASIAALQLCLDKSDNILVAGNFSGSADFDPGTLQYNLTAASYYADNFILKLNRNGELVWVKQIGGPTSLSGPYNCLSTDQNNNVIVAGSFSGGDCDFDPGVAVTNLNSTGNYTGYALKLDSNGVFNWVSPFLGSSGSVYIRSVHTSGSDIYCTGYFMGTVDVDPGPNSYLLTSNGDAGTAIRLNGDGSFLWASELTYPVFCSAMKAGGFLYTGSSNGGSRMLTKFAVNGVKQWEFGWEGSNVTKFTALSVDDANIYAAGFFSATNDFDPGAGTDNLSSIESSDYFFQKLNDLQVLNLAFINLTAARNMNGTLLNWQITNGQQTKGIFTIERGTNEANLVGMAAVNLLDNSTSFSLLDAGLLPGTYFYRIKFTAATGRSIYSRIVSVNNNPLLNGGIKAWPMPLGNELNISTSVSYSNATIRLFDITGKLLFLRGNYNGNYFNVPCNQLPRGGYSVVISDSNNQQQTSVVK